MRQTLDAFLETQHRQQSIPADLAEVLRQLAQACAQISRIVAMGDIIDGLGSAGQHNVQDEEQKKLDIVTNEVLLGAFADSAPRGGGGV